MTKHQTENYKIKYYFMIMEMDKKTFKILIKNLLYERI
jgi:hypothetical protein